ncbi:hypothetical protein BdWA1_001716 [Babesia duncani]|uniref:Uncharacterized protein n=1 Tax=Babesia duncani TaxID=323732 RepID=A0AAD9PKQ2_9APIC|nr:hypothetical protein BdWA1_001716 [Babesia duncani]
MDLLEEHQKQIEIISLHATICSIISIHAALVLIGNGMYLLIVRDSSYLSTVVPNLLFGVTLIVMGSLCIYGMYSKSFNIAIAIYYEACFAFVFSFISAVLDSADIIFRFSGTREQMKYNKVLYIYCSTFIILIFIKLYQWILMAHLHKHIIDGDVANNWGLL